jgi:hypothetical protein
VLTIFTLKLGEAKMAKEILAVSSRSSNPVSHLAYLINAALEARSSHSDSFSTDYRQQLCTLVGLSFTAALTEGSKMRTCKPSLAAFLRYNNLNRPEKFELLSVAIAKMVCNAIYSFKVLGYPWYFDDFLGALTHAVSPSDTVSTETKNGIREVLLELLEKYS